MSTRSNIHSWLNEYGESHADPTNEIIHWICVPVIFFCVIGLLFSIPSPVLPLIGDHLWANAVVLLTLVFYAIRSMLLFVEMGAWCALCYWLTVWIHLNAPLWVICLVLFILAWVGQFMGHKIEGKKPSFLKDLQFLLIGPAWLMAKIYRRLGIGY